MKNEQGFTLIEMLIVLFVISVLILVTVPNVTKHFASIDEKGCDAYISMVQAQVEAYKIDYLKYPTLKQLEDAGYIKGDATCPNGNTVVINSETGEVSEGNTNVQQSNDSTKPSDGS